MHDELIFRVREHAVDKAAPLIKEIMQSVMVGPFDPAEEAPMWELRVPLPVKVQVGPSWGELEEWVPPTNR